MNKKGNVEVNMHHFVKCWQEKEAKKHNTYGLLLGNKEWYWYENYIQIFEQYRIDNNL
jgi:hypothetical protein